MKSRFSTIDIKAILTELNRYKGMRVFNIYDIDHKTYLIKLQKPDEKGMILIESGIRLHSTEFEWPKSNFPSSFSMKMRKHLKGRRLESIEQLGIDRIVDFQFGSGEAAYHIILELYDRGNIVLTDYEYIILNILRPRADDNQDVRFAVREKYPVNSAKQYDGQVTMERLREIMQSYKEGDTLRRALNPQVIYGPALLEHCLLGVKLQSNIVIGKGFHASETEDLIKVIVALGEADKVLQDTNNVCKGYITQKREKKPNVKPGEEDTLLTYQEFHPFQFRQHENTPIEEFTTFNQAVDTFFSQVESQKLDMKTLHQEKSALKKLENVKKDHEKRLDLLQKEQDLDTKKAMLIEMNLPLVDGAIHVIQSALANQIDWQEIWDIVKEAQSVGDPVAISIKGLKLDTNHILMLLRCPYNDGEEDEGGTTDIQPIKIEIDLGLSAYANARRYYDMKKHAAKKEQKTIAASSKALKSAEQKTKQALKEVAITASINKARKVYWFEKFFWFISSENYLVIGGRDQQQNEIIVKKYLRPGDYYVHADLHGASSVVIKNPTVSMPIPPKTLNEAGSMAICYSAAWEARVVTSAWWVYHSQVSKTAPSGEYLTTGSFMIRGKKNYLPPSHLIFGFGFMFKLEEGSIFRHRGERKIRSQEEDELSVITEVESIEIDLDEVSNGEESETGSESGQRSPLDERPGQRSPSVERSDQSSPMESLPETSDGLSNEDQLDSGLVPHENDSINANYASQSENIGFLPNNDSQSTNQTELQLKSDSAINDSDPKQSESKNDTIEQSEPPEILALKSDDSDNDDRSFPDTQISLQHLTGHSSTVGMGTETPHKEVDSNMKTSNRERMSAKQKRELKKAVKKKEIQEEAETVEDVIDSGESEDISEPRTHSIQSQTHSIQNQPQQPQQLKRRQKSKLKKIKEKYKDQDDEERQLKMEILASAGKSEEDTKKDKKRKKIKQKEQKQKQQQQQQQQQKQKYNLRENVMLQSNLVDQSIIQPSLKDSSSGEIKPDAKQLSAEEHAADDMTVDEEMDSKETLQASEDAGVLDSLTGIPQPDDELLFSVPVCAPYSTMTNFKFKVKLTPGTAKRGKGAKMALHMFLYDKTTTQREKDLLKSVKDTDLSRNIPGKVKVSAPNLHKGKRK